MATIRDRYVLEVDVDNAERGVGRARGAIGGLVGSLARVGPAAAAAAVALGGVAAVRGISNTISEMDDLAKAARNVGVTSAEGFEDFQVIQNTLGEMGLSAGETERALRNMTTRLEQAATTGQGTAADAFAALGDRILDANGNLLDMPQLFEQVTGAIQDGTISLTDAQKIFGEITGPQILGGFEDLAARGVSVADALADVEANSNIVGLDAANNAEAFGDTMGRLQEVAGRLGTELVSALLPTLNNLAEGALAVLPGIIEGVQAAFSALSPVFEALQPVVGAFFELLQALWPVFETLLGVIAPVAEILAGALTTAITTVTTIIEGVIETVRGFIEVLGGVRDRVGEIVESVGGGFSDMGERISSSVGEAAQNVKDGFDGLWQYLWGGSVAKNIVEETKSGFSDMGASMLESVGNAARNIRTRFSEIYNSIRGSLGEALGAGVDRTRQLVGQFGDWFNDTFRDVNATAEDTQTALNNTLNGEGVTGQGLNESADRMQRLAEQMETVNPLMTEHRDILQELAELQTNTSAPAYTTMQEATDAFLESLGNLEELQQTQIETNQSLAEVYETYVDNITELNDLFTTTIENTEGLNEQTNTLQETLATVTENIAALSEATTDSITTDEAKIESLDNLNDIMTMLAEETSTSFVDGMNAMGEAMNSQIEVANALSTSLERMAATAAAAQSAAQAATQELNALQAAQANVNPANENPELGFGLPPTDPLDFFAGAFARGGFIPRGQFGLVGEQGPEFIQGPAQITPIQPSSTNVTYNINAVDAQSFRNMVAQDPSFIHAVAEKGRQRMPGGRR